ncbi:zinc finger CW-type PWWP domain protein 1 [Spea bombifrons]|uniref:zinc finger CW-type PWWP domain protein 1 n=1 Tax=Spea bombifrons TaxID=233779 RepID=UPI00234AEDB8|nr:zinc finger CW-type PWWP domain protein 1 [Spea bombifrons]
MRWRRLGEDVDPLLLADDWSCEQNTDVSYNRCQTPEETCADSDDEIVYTTFVPGSIVWAKQHGYPWWPAVIDYDPDSPEYFVFNNSVDPLPSKYHVAFLEEPVTRAWVCSTHLKSFHRHSADSINKKLKNADMSLKLEGSIKMAHEALALGIQERIRNYGFCQRYRPQKAEGPAVP